MDFNNEEKKARNALKKQKQEAAFAKKKENELKKATSDFNSKKDAGIREHQQEIEQAKRESKKMLQEQERMVKQAAREANVDNMRSNKGKRLINNIKNRKSIEKSFNSLTQSKFSKLGKAPKKSTTMVFRQTKYKASNNGSDSLSALKTSLGHSLRISSLKRDVLEYKDEFLKDNIYYYDGQYYTDEELEPIKQDIFDKIVGDKETELNDIDDANNKKDVKKYSDLRSNYKRKILKTAPKNKKLQKLMDILESGSGRNATLEHEKIKGVVELTRKHFHSIVDAKSSPDGRKKQMKKNLETYLSHRTKHQEVMSYDRKINKSNDVLISEFIMKLPHASGEFDISAKEYNETLRSFFEQNFNHDILLSVTHCDERLIDSVASGNNCHVFINCKNNKTNQYDWRKSIINFARENQDQINEKYNLDFDFPDHNNLTDKEICHCFQALQLSFFDFAQDKLFTKKGYALRFLTESERSDQKYIINCLQESMPLASRQASRFNAIEEMLLKNQKELELSNNKIQELTELSQDQEEIIETLKSTVNSKTEQKKELSSDILSKIGQKDQLEEEIEKLENKQLDQAIKKVDAWMDTVIKSKNKNDDDTDGSGGFGTLTTIAAARAIDTLEESQPKIGEKIKTTAVKFEGENTVKENLKISNNLKNKKSEKNTSRKFKR